MHFKALFFAILTFFSVIRPGHTASVISSSHSSTKKQSVPSPSKVVAPTKTPLQKPINSTAPQKVKPQPKKVAPQAKTPLKKPINSAAPQKPKPQPKKVASKAKAPLKKPINSAAPQKPKLQPKKVAPQTKAPLKKPINSAAPQKPKLQPKKVVPQTKAPLKKPINSAAPQKPKPQPIKAVSIAKTPLKKPINSAAPQKPTPQPKKINPAPQTKALAPKTTTPVVSSQQKSLQKTSSSQFTLMAAKKAREEEIKKIKEASEKALKDLQTQSEQKKQLTAAKQKEFQDAWLAAYKGDKNKLAWVENLRNDPDILSWVEHSMPFNYFHPDKYESSKNPAHAKRLADFAFSIAEKISNATGYALDGVAAIKWYTTAINTQKDHLKALQSLAKLYHHGLKDKKGGYLIEQNSSLASHYYTEISKITPNSQEVVEGFISLGNMAAKAANARDYYEKALDIKPDSIDIHLKLGDLYFSGATDTDPRDSVSINHRKAFHHYFKALTSGKLSNERAQEITKRFFNGKFGNGNTTQWPAESLPTNAKSDKLFEDFEKHINGLSTVMKTHGFETISDFSFLKKYLRQIIIQPACMVNIENEELKKYLSQFKTDNQGKIINNDANVLRPSYTASADKNIREEIRLINLGTSMDPILYLSLGHENVAAADAFNKTKLIIAHIEQYNQIAKKGDITTAIDGFWNPFKATIQHKPIQDEKRKLLKASLGWLPDLAEKTP